MNARRPDPLRVASGSADGETFVHLLRVNLGDGDELFHRLRTMPDDDVLRGFARTLQKYLERDR
jgi:hypothetical protein